MTDEENIVIIGCGAAGGTAAQFARKTNRKAHISIFEQGAYPQYSKCGLPYVLSGDIPQAEGLIEFSKEWFEKEKINLFLNSKIVKLSIEEKKISHIHNAVEKKASFDKLIISTGATPSIPPIKNITENNSLIHGVYVVRTIDDIQQIKKNIQKDAPVVIVGGGFIGLEVAEALHHQQMNVSVIEALPSVLSTTLDPDMSNLVEKKLSEYIALLTNHVAVEVKTTNQQLTHVLIQDRETKKITSIQTKMLVIAAGVGQQVELAKTIGCRIGTTGGIVVNNKCQTSIPDVYAVGDCTEYLDFIHKKPVPIGLGSIAVRQGIAAGINAAGGTYILFPGVLQTRTTKFFDIEVAGVGPVTSQLQDQDIVTSKFTGSSLPSYFPGGKPITIKVITDSSTGRILAAQAVGENVAQRINIFACAILEKMTDEKLRKMETAYAPPVAPTLDTVTVVCDVSLLKRKRKK